MGNYRFIEVKSWKKKNNKSFRTSEVFMYRSITGALAGRVSRYLFKTSVIAYAY